MRFLIKLALLLMPMTLLAQAPQIPLTGNIGSGYNGPLINSPAVVFATDADHTMVYPEMSGSGGTIIVTSGVTLTATRNLIAPNTGIFNWVVRNNTTGGQSINVKVAGGTGVSIANGDSLVVMCDTVNCYVPGGQNVTQFLAPTASWPSWLVPTVTNPYTAPSLAVTAAYTPLSAVTGTAPVVATPSGSTVAISLPVATTSVDGYLSSTDWNTFNSKQAALSYTPAHSGTNSDITSLSGLTTALSPAQGGTGGDGIGYAYGNGGSAFTYSTTIPNSGLENSSTTVNGQTCTLGSPCTVTAAATSLAVGTTTITSGTSGDIEYDNGGVLGEKGVTGTGSVVLASSPSIASPTITSSFTATGLVTNTDLANSTISGVSLGSNLDPLTFGTHLVAGGSSYNGGANVTITSDATSADTVSTIVARDSSGNFSAGAITAALSGNATSASAIQCYGASCPNYNQTNAPFTDYASKGLVSDMTTDSTSAVVSGVISGFPSTGELQIENEAVIYSSYATGGGNTTFTLLYRGIHGTTIAAHSAANTSILGVVSSVALCTTCAESQTFYNTNEVGYGQPTADLQGSAVYTGAVRMLYGLNVDGAPTTSSFGYGMPDSTWMNWCTPVSGGCNNDVGISRIAGGISVDTTAQGNGLGTITAALTGAVNGVTLSNAGVATQYLDKTGNYSTPAGTGTVTTSGSPVSPNIAAFSSSTAITAATSANIQTAIGAGVYDASGAAAARQAAYTNLTSIGSLANAAGWLHNDGSGNFAYSTPSIPSIASTANLLSGDGSGNAVSSGIAASNVPLLNAANIFTNTGTNEFGGDIAVNGNVGIGTTSPSSKLVVDTGVSKTIAQNTSAAWFKADDANGYDLGLDVLIGGNSTQSSHWTGISSYENSYGSQPLILQNLGGNVGIGTTNPTDNLSVYTASGTGARIDVGSGVNGNNAGYRFLLQDATNGLETMGIYGVPANPTNQRYLGFTPTDGSYAMVVRGDGDVGIGTTNPAALLSVGSSNQFQVSSTGVSSAGAGSTDYSTASSAQVVHCLADGTGGGVCPASAAQTTVSCSIAGTATFSEPFTGTSYKKVIYSVSGCQGTVLYTFPVAFTTGTTQLSQAGGTNTVTNTSITWASISALTAIGVIEGW